MTELSPFSEEEQVLLVSLPYKVGMWVSYADDVGGEQDDALESRALESCIKAVARLHEDKPFIKAVAAETLRRRESWERWATQAFHVLSEVKAAVQLLEASVPSEQVKNYKAMLMEIASAVAQASGEFQAFDDIEEKEGRFAAFIGRIAGKLSGLSHDDDNHPMNVSASESAALDELRTVLKNKGE